MGDNQLEEQIRKWSERAEIARKQGQDELVTAALELKAMCEALSGSADTADKRPELLVKANRLRNEIEAGEQHRTMCVEHGLSDAAIDATYEIQALEKKLISLMQGAKD
jgi:hypothetical protein